MACGVHLGILLICFIHAEYVRCLWATQAQRQHGKSYVGVLQPNSGFGSSYPQNQLRQASVYRGSAQSSSLNAQTAVSSGSSWGLSGSGYTQTVSHPAKSGSSSVRIVQSNSVSKPNWRPSKERVPKKQHFSLSPIASGSSVSQYDKNKNSKRSGPIRQGTSSASKYRSSNSASLQSPSRESYSFKSASHQSTAQKAPAYSGQRGYSPMKSSSLFDAGVLGPNRSPVRTKTSASAPARRVSSRQSSKASKPSRFSSLQKERARNNPSQMEAGKPHQGKPFPVTGGNVQGSYKPTSTSNFASSHGSYSQSRPVSNKHSSSFQPRSQKMSKPSYTSTEQSPSRAGPSGQRFAPTRTYDIPKRYGGFAIRRLKDSDQKEVGVRKPQQAYQAPQRPAAQQAYQAPQRPAAQQAYQAPQRPAAQQAYQAPQRPAAQQAYQAPQRPAAQQAYQAPQRPAAQQAYQAPQRPAAQQAYQAPQRPAAQQAYQAPQRPAAQQAYQAPQRPAAQQVYQVPKQQSAHPKSQFIRVKPESKWQRVSPNLKQPQVQ